MTHHRYNGKFQSHGFQVAIGTLTMCAFFDEFFKMDLSTLDVDACVAAWPSLEAEQRRALDLFRDFPVPELGYTEITKKWNDAETVRVQLTRVKENWPAFKARLQAQCYPFEKMRALFAAAGCADRSFADRCFARAVAQHGRFHAVVALAHQSARSGQTRTDLR